MNPAALLTAMLVALAVMTESGQAVVQPAARCEVIAPGPQDGLSASPENHSVLYEDADVRVLDVHSRPHSREAWHTHARPGVMYVDSEGPGIYMTPENPKARVRGAEPTFTYRVFATRGNEGLHATENTGEVPFHAIRVELKHPGCGLPGSMPALPWQDAAPIAAASNETVLFENADVRVVDVRIAAGATNALPRQPWTGVFYVTPAQQSGEPGSRPSPIRVARDKTVLPAADEAHFVEQSAGMPLHFVRFELKYASPPAGGR